MLFPTDAYELVHSHAFLGGTVGIQQFPQMNSAALPAVKHYYGAQLPESEWVKQSPPFIVWVPTRDTFDANRPEAVKEVRGGRLIEMQPPERVQAGHTIHFFVKLTKDLAAYREMFALLVRFRLAMRYALNTTANYRTDGGAWGGDADLARYPNMLHYTLNIAPYVPVVDVPWILAEVTSLSIVSSGSVAGGE